MMMPENKVILLGDEKPNSTKKSNSTDNSSMLLKNLKLTNKENIIHHNFLLDSLKKGYSFQESSNFFYKLPY
jgi:hypothetical protein